MSGIQKPTTPHSPEPAWFYLLYPWTLPPLLIIVYSKYRPML